MTPSFRRRHGPRIALAALLALALGGGAMQWHASSGAAPQNVVVRACTVSSVHDGDSLRARCPGFKKTLRIRLDQIDAPEIGQAYGTHSRDLLRALCPVRSAVEIHDLGPDRYGRTLARVFCKDKDANAAMVAAGAAWVYDHYADDRKLYALQDEARRERRGLWAAGTTPVAPWEFRRRNRK